MTTLTVAAACLVAAAPASAAPVATGYTQGLSSTPTDIALGPDGNLWFTEAGGPGRVGRISPAGLVTEFTAGLTPKAQPTGIVAGSDGAMWFTERAKARIGRIAADGSITEFPLPAGSQPIGIAGGPGGDLWYADHSGAIGRMTTAGAVTRYLALASKPEEIAVGSDGNVWFTDEHGVGRVTPLGALSLGLVSTEKPGDIAPGPDGNLWVTDPKGPGAIGRVSLLGVLTQFTAGLTPGSQPDGIVAGPGGDLWFAESHAPAAIGRIDATGAITEYALSDDLKPGKLVAALDGALWFTSPGAIGRFAFLAGAPDGGGSGGSGDGGSEVPLPRLGRAVVVHPVKGTVRVRRADGHGFEKLEDGETIPLGSLVDTRQGTVRLSSAVDGDGHTQSGIFSGGLFSVRQAAGGVTDLYLRGGSFARCGRSLKAVASAADRKRRPVRKLWGRDRSGKFRTHGRDRVATVRGTTWLTQDRCDGTLTVVKSGAVSVRDRRTKRTVIVRAGGRHLARRAAR
jgi:streptogramin lyase